MDQFYQMLDLQLSTLVYLGIGVFAYRKNMITDDNRNQLISLILNVLMPALVFNSFRAVSPEILKTGLWALIGSTVIYTFYALIGRFAYRNIKESQRKVLDYATLVNNAGLAGQPLSLSMYGNIGALYASIFLIPHRIFMWSLGIEILEGSKNEVKGPSTLSKLLRNPSIVAVFFGLARGFFQIELPTFLDRSIITMASIVSPFSRILIGSIIATISLHSLFEKGVLRYTVIRLFVIPLSVLFISKMIGLDETLIGV
ncbi:MAG: AEC family transporter, partial [Atopostipes suicloacalis]|nr:AEC family transporter [Atopostipes suicloacalis]